MRRHENQFKKTFLISWAQNLVNVNVIIFVVAIHKERVSHRFNIFITGI